MAFLTVCIAVFAAVFAAYELGLWAADVIASEILGPVWGA
jgi:hypothetical protein